MPSLKTLHSLLTEVASKLDDAAKEIRDIPLEPTKLHIHKIGEALANVFEIQHVIYEFRPDLKPDYLREEVQASEASQALADALLKASGLVGVGEIAAATSVLRQFLESNPPIDLKQIAEDEISKLEGSGP